jgi:ABC-type uncharacterized transport system ATPase subunit
VHTCRLNDDPRGLPVTVAATHASSAAVRVDALVLLSDITVRFDGITALNAVNFELGVGEVRALVGENGAGKTTSLDSILGHASVAGEPTAEGLEALAPRGRTQRGEGS